MNDRSITVSLLIVFLLLTLLIIGVGALGMHAMHQLNLSARNVASQQWTDVRLSREALDYSSRNSQINFSLFVCKDRPQIDALLAERNENSAKISTLLAELQTRIDSSAERDRLNVVLETRQAYISSYQRATQLLLAGRQSDAQEYLIHSTTPLLEAYHSTFRAYADFQTDEMNAQLNRSTAQYHSAFEKVAVMTTVSALLASCLAAFVFRTIFREMRRRQCAEDELRELNAGLEIKISERTASLEKSNRDLALEIEEHRRSQELVDRLSVAIEQSPVSVIITELSGTVIYANPKFLEITGYTRQEVIGRNPRILKSGYTTQQEYVQLWQTITAGKEWRGELCNRKKNGDLFWESAVICPVRDEKGNVTHFLAVKEDITERRQAEKDLRLMRFSLENASDSVFWVDPQGHVLYANEAASRALGWSRQEFTSLSVADIDPLLPREKWQGFWEELKRSGSISFETQQRHKEGRVFPIEVTANFLEFDGQEYLFAFTHDISQRRVIQAQLQQAQKMESIGQLAAGIAHEINTPTQFVRDNLAFLSDSWKSTKEMMDLYRKIIHEHATSAPQSFSDAIAQAEHRCDFEFIVDEAPRAIEQGLDGAHRIAEIVQAMKAFSHPDSSEKTATNLNKAVESTITVARNEWKYVADLVTDFDDSIPPVICYPGDINQVVLNLLVNAAHAIDDKLKEHAKGLIQVRTRKQGNIAEISVTDNGTGIPEEIRTRIFDPFFTTKEVGKGTGQGLSIAYAIVVKKHSGKLRFESALGKGTTFFIEIPIDPTEHQSAKASGLS